MAHMKDLNTQMKIQAERIRLQSREGWTPPSGGQSSVDPDPVHRDNRDDRRMLKKATMKRQNTDRSKTVHMQTATSNRPSVRGRDDSSASSKIPIRKNATRMTSLARTHHKTANKGQKHVKFERPSDYTWHKAGRIQEIRTRYIARKFCNIWVSACFGKVGPHKIRAHYHKCLLRKIWVEWHDMWWVNRREWRLQVRAQYHFRYCMTRKVWQAWSQFVVMQRNENVKTSAAIVYANTKRLQSTFSAWKQYMAYRSIKKKNFGNAYRIADTRRLAQAWYQWTAQIRGVRDKQDMQRHALQHWADGLVHKTWMTWLARLAESMEMKRKEQLSIDMYHRRLLSRCFFQGLVPYVLHRRDRKREKGVASQFYTSNIIHKHFQHWHTSWFTRRSLALLGQQIDIMAHRARLRRAWIHWQFYISLQHIKAEKISQAIQHRHRHLLKQGLHAFHTAVSMRKLKDIHKQRADELKYSLVLRRSWGIWLQGCEHKEELRLFVQTRKARNHYNHFLMSQVMHGWLRYTRWRQHRTAQYTKADAHYISYLLPKCIARFQMFAQTERDKRYMQQQSQQFRRECLLGFSLARWYQAYHLSLDVRMMERMAIMHYDHNVAQRMLIVWKQRTRSQLQDQAKEDLAMDHFVVHLMRNAVHTWKAYTMDSVQRRGHQYQAARHHYLVLLKKGWVVWTQFVVHQKLKANKLLKADMYYRHKALQRNLDAWKTYQKGILKVYEIVDERQQKHNMETLRWAFALWIENVRFQCEEKRISAIAEHHHSTCVLKKVLTMWRQYAILHGHKKSQQAERLCQIKAHLDKGKCLRIFQAWRCYKDIALLQHLAEKRATLHFRRRLLCKMLAQWKKYRQLQIKKTLLQRQCVWLHNTRISAKYFLLWRAQHHAALADHSKTTVALWQWSLVLQQKVLNAWVQYVLQQRCKKQRIALAMEARRQRLLKEGVSQWLRVSMDISERREKRAAHQHAQVAYRSYNTVRRCANHWRQRTLANRFKKPDKRMPPHERLNAQDAPRSQPQSASMHSERLVQQQQPVSSRHTRPMQRPGVPLDERVPGLPPKASTTVPSVAHSATHSFKERFDTTGSVLGDGVRSTRPKPRRPDFLMESLQKEGLWKSASFHPNSDSEIHTVEGNHLQSQLCDSEDDHEEDDLQESLPRRTPQPSPQPKRFTEHSKAFAKQRSDRWPDTGNTLPVLTTDDTKVMHCNGKRDKMMVQVGGAIPSAHFLMPPSAFTTIKADSDKTKHQQTEHLSQTTQIISSVQTSDIHHNEPQKHHQEPSRTNIGTTLAVVHKDSLGTGLSLTSQRTHCESTNDVPNSGQLHLLSPDAFASKDHPKNAEVISSSGRNDVAGDHVTNESSHGHDEVYKEITELKNQLLQYQQAKQRLRSLKEQYVPLKSWLQQLEGDGNHVEMLDNEDDDTRDVRDEVTEMESEITELTSELDRRKPECAQILSKINTLALQIQ